MYTSDTAREYFYDDSSMIESTNTYLEFSTTESYMEAEYNYNNAGMATDITYLLDGTTQKEKYSYQYNDNGMITQETLLGYEKTVAEQTVINHTYDDIGRLTLSSSVTESITTTYGYDYDKVGNRDQQVITIDGTAITTNYDYDELYQLDNAIMVNGEKLSYLYDSLGRMSEQLLESSTDEDIEKQSYVYYDNGRLKTVTVDDLEGTNDDIVDNYMYNAQGKRLIKDTDGEITKYLYSGGSVIMELDEDNTRLVENIVDLSGAVIASRKRNGTEALKWDFYHYDIRRSTTSIISYDGTKQAAYEYDAFGNVIDSELIASVSNEITYTSARNDGETELYYMHGRYYNSNIGRFLTQDSYKGSAYEPWTQNLYTYTGNNPVNFIDPTGHRRINNDDDVNYGGVKPKSNDYYGSGYDDWIDDYDLSYEESTSEKKIKQIPVLYDGHYEYVDPEGMKLAFEAIKNTVTIDIGIGGGIGGSVKVAKMIGVDAVIKSDFWHIQYSDNEWNIGTKNKYALGGTLAGLGKLGASYTEFRPKNSPREDTIKDSKYHGGLGTGIELYYGFGFEVNIQLDFKDFILEIISLA